jgi:ATP-dependent helicase/nuclease subunit B
MLSEKGEEFRQRLPEWRNVVTELATRFRLGDAEVDPKNPPETCKFCQLQPLCRIHERIGAPLTAEEDSA